MHHLGGGERAVVLREREERLSELGAVLGVERLERELAVARGDIERLERILAA